MERADDDDFGRADDVGHRRVHFGVEILELHIHDRCPGFLVIFKHQFEQHLDDASLGRGKFATFDLGVIAAIAAEEVFHQDEDQASLHGDERRPLERPEAHHVQTGRHKQGMHVLAELEHLNAIDRHFRGTPHHVEEADPHMAGKTLIDQLQGGHAPADDAVLG